MKNLSENAAVQIETDRLAQLRAQQEQLVARCRDLEATLASANARTATFDPVAVALGEVTQPQPARDEIHDCRGRLAQLVRAVDIQTTRLTAAVSEAAFEANESARPAHVEACRKLFTACDAFALAIAAERAVRQSVLAAGHNCLLDPVGEPLVLPIGALADLKHYVAIHSADPAGEPISSLALVDVPAHGVKCGEALMLNPRQFAILRREGAVELVANPLAVPKRHQRAEAATLIFEPD